jgi:hypothetical protein
MAAEDYAIVVGISKYPQFGDLQGPEHDAQAFYDWLCSPQGGNIPPHQIGRVLSSQLFNPADDPLLAQPALQRVDYEFERLIEAGAARDDGRLGRRLYIFLAGHGFGPDLEEAALLMANANRRRMHHLPGRRYALWFQTAALFDEIVLFMDCCRDDYPRAPVYVPPWPEIRRPAGANVRYFYGFATKWSSKAREKQIMPGGPVRGLFTWALLTALEKAPRDAQGRITGAAVEGYVFNQLTNELKRLVGENEYQEPRFEYNKQRDIVFVETPPEAAPPPTTIPVHLQPAQAIVGQRVEILNHRFKRVAETEAVADSWTVSLGAGIYQARVPGTTHEKVFDVIGEEAINVNLD